MTKHRLPDNPGPNGADEHRLRPLDPTIRADLVNRYAPRWLALSGFGPNRLDDVPGTVELLVAEEWKPGTTGLVLRLRSWYTGSTYWLDSWTGDPADAATWIDEVAELQARNVEGDRRHGPTPWD